MPTSRSRGGDRFYHPPAMRHRLQEQQQQQLERSNGCVDSAKSSADELRATTEDSVEVGDAKLTNFDRFLMHTTPKVQAHFFNKRGTGGWRTRHAEFHPYFVLGDLWESFRQWSAYGAEVPLLFDGSEPVVQYYVPYLSGIQLYINPSRPSTRPRRPVRESDMDLSRETSSDGSSDYRAERSASCIVGDWGRQNVDNGDIQNLSRLSLGNGSCISNSSDENETCSPPRKLVFEYLEHSPPFNREPLADKISVLASHYPELRTYKSCDLSPSSWISVAWYPIYRIPTGPTLQNLDACFLTFHSLATPSYGTSFDGTRVTASNVRGSHNADSSKLSLPTMGLGLYKFKVSFWNSNGDQECQKASSLLSAADIWLRGLQVNHPDYNFFVSRNTYQK